MVAYSSRCTHTHLVGQFFTWHVQSRMSFHAAGPSFIPTSRDAFKCTRKRTCVCEGGGRGLGSGRIVLPRWADPRGVIDHGLPGVVPRINHRPPARPQRIYRPRLSHLIYQPRRNCWTKLWNIFDFFPRFDKTVRRSCQFFFCGNLGES